METVNLKAVKRDITGRKVKKLRQNGHMPANVYGKNKASQAIDVVQEDFKVVFRKTGETGLIDLNIDGEKEKRPVLVHDMQLHPVTGDVLHVDFLQVDLKVKITAQIPLVMEGESPAEKSGMGTVVQQMDEVEVEALPANLPENIVVDVSDLTEVDQAILVKDLKVDTSKVEIKDDLEGIVVKVEPPQKVEEVVPVASATPSEEGQTAATEVSPATDEQAENLGQ